MAVGVIFDENKMHQTFCRNSKFYIGIKSESYQLVKILKRPLFYDARPFTDVINFQMIIDDAHMEEVSFPITIQRRKMPVLTYREGDTFSDMVTIVTKTFMRYNCLDNLLSSLDQFYPNVRVIIADDTPDALYQSINITQVCFNS